MKITDLIPWRSEGKDVPARRQDMDPVRALKQDIDRAFGNFWSMLPFPLPDIDQLDQGNGVPIDVSDNGKEVIVKAELPGISEQDVDVTVDDGQLRIRGEKKLDRETTEEGVSIRERVYGTLERIVPLPDGVEADSAKATFKNGVLTIVLPKSQEALANIKRVPVHAH